MSAEATVYETRRALVDVVPVLSQRLQRRTIVGEIDALDHVTVDVQIVCPLDIALLARGSQGNNRNDFQFVVLLDLLQQFEAVHAPHFEIQQDQTRHSGWTFYE